VWTLDQAIQYIKAGSWPVQGGPYDLYFPYVTMLLHGDGTNGAQNNTFLDSSTNNFSITRNGNTTQGSFSPYGSNWSNSFNGSTDYFTTPASSSFQFGTGNFTIEYWLYTTNLDVAPVAQTFNSGGSAIQPYITSSGQFELYIGGTAYYSSSGIVSKNTWQHIAIVRNSNTITFYVNGVAGGSVTHTGSAGDNAAFGIGARANAGYKVNGYLSNVRITNTAVYTSAFTPSTTPFTAIAGTVLLTCQSNRFIDNSTNAFAITVNGTPSVQRFSPFSPTAAYSTSTIGGSGYFDGSGDYLSMTSGTSLGSGDFTISCWVYLTAAPGVETPVGCSYNYYTAGNNGNFVFRVGTANLWNSFDGQGNSAAVNGSFTWQTNTWIHMAWVRSGTTVTVYRNGVSLGSTTDSKTLSNSSNGYFIGHDRINGAAAGYITGYIADFRVVVGSAITSVPTAPTTAISGTSLLCSMTNGGIFDNAMMNNLETVGNAQISTSVVKFGTGSMAFDGSGDGLALPANVNLAIGSGNFTIEMWINGSVSNNNTTKGGSFARAFTLGTAQGTGNIEVYFNDSNNCIISISAGTNIQFASSSILSSAWVHFAIVRSGTTLTAYANGTSVGSTTNSTNLNLAATTQSWIGAISSSAGTFNGYIDDLRITKGYARYTTTFTPPTAAFQNQ
jgi:hypothetical protein